VQELGGTIARPLVRLVNGRILYHKHHAELINGGWPGGRHAFLITFSFLILSLKPVFSRSSNVTRSLDFSRSLAFFGNLMKFEKSGGGP